MGSVSDQLDLIAASLAKSEARVAVFVHNIDGSNMRTEKSQMLLSRLASIPRLKFVCSIDHINTSLMWDSSKLAGFNFVWHETTTFREYFYEHSFENMMVKPDSAKGVSGALHVLTSLNREARGLFLYLGRFQMQTLGNADDEGGISATAFLRHAKESFLVSTEAAFKTHLIEFQDHALVQTRKARDGGELYYVPMDSAMLAEICEQIDDE